MKKLCVSQIYRWNARHPPAELIQAFNEALSFPTIAPDVKMRLHALGDVLQKQISYASETHQQLQKTYTAPGEEGGEIAWLGDDEEVQRENRKAFLADFNALLNTEIEIKPLPLSALQKASDRYWTLLDRGLVNGTQPIDAMISALMPIIQDDINPPPETEPEVDTNGTGTPPVAATAQKRPPKRRK